MITLSLAELNPAVPASYATLPNTYRRPRPPGAHTSPWGFSTTTSDRTYGKGQTRQRYGMCTSTKQEDVRADHPAYHVRKLWSTSVRPLAARPKCLGTGP